MEGIEFLSLFSHAHEGCRLAVTRHLLSKTCWKAIVEMMAESRIAPVDKGSEGVELDDVVRDLLSVLHLEIVETVFGVPDNVVRAKLGCQLRNEGGPMSVPVWRAEGRVGECRQEPVHSGAPKE